MHQRLFVVLLVDALSHEAEISGERVVAGGDKVGLTFNHKSL